MNGQSTTGTVHKAHRTTYRGFEYLVQDCGISALQGHGLAETTQAVTCQRCLNLRPAKKAAPARIQSTGSSSTTWGVYNSAGELVAWRQTRKEAAAVAERWGSGFTFQKI